MTSADEGDTDSPQPTSADSGIGRSYVGAKGITVLAGIIIAAMIIAIYVLVVMWPVGAAAPATPSHIFGFRVVPGEEQRLFVIVALSGALGGLIHSARSLYEYVGNRMLRRSWLLMYLVLPFVGGGLAVVFYVILRGGLITGTASQVNPFGFAAISALVGLFSPEAAEKLKQIFSTLLTPAPPGRDHLTTGADATVESIEPGSGGVGTTVRLYGRHLSGATEVLFTNARAAATVVSDTEISTVVPQGASPGRVRVVVAEQIVNAPGKFRVEP